MLISYFQTRGRVELACFALVIAFLSVVESIRLKQNRGFNLALSTLPLRLMQNA